MPIRLTASVTGQKKLQKRLNAAQGLPRSISSDARFQETMVERTKHRFKTKIDPEGRRWKALSRKNTFPRFNQNRQDILVDHGRLRESIGITGRRGFATGFGFRVGITDPSQVAKGQVHQLGGFSEKAQKPVPARPFLGISKQDRTVMERLARSIAREKLARA